MLYTNKKGFIRTAGRKLSNVLNIVSYSSGKLPAPAIKADCDLPSDKLGDRIAAAISMKLLPASLQSAYRTNITRQEFCNLAMQLIKAGKRFVDKTLFIKEHIGSILL